MVTALLILSGCSAEQEGSIKRLAMPVASTEEAPMMHDLWVWSWLAAMITGVLVWGLIFYVAIRYHRRSEDEIPVQTRYNLPIEIFYTIAPIMMVIVFFYFTVDTQDKVLHVDKKPDENVTVVGQTSAGYVSVTPTPVLNPQSSTINFHGATHAATDFFQQFVITQLSQQLSNALGFFLVRR